MQTNEEPSAAPPEEPQNRIQGVGETLRSAREAARVSLEQAGEELRIEAKFLAALEDERYEDIGIPVFTKGYLKHYCEYLGVDYRRLLPLYQEKAGQQPPPLRGRPSIERREESSSGVWVVMGLAVIVLVLFAAWLLRDRLPAASGTSSTTPAPLSTQTPGQSSAGTDAKAGSSTTRAPLPSTTRAPSPSTAQTPAPSGVEARARSDAAAAPAVATAPVSQPAAAAESSDAARSLASEPSQSAAGAVSPAASTAAGPRLDIDMKFVQDSWVEVKDSTETRLYYGLGKAGEESHLVGAPPLAVVIGNADGVVLEVDGEPYAFPRRRNGNVATFTLTAPAE